MKWKNVINKTKRLKYRIEDSEWNLKEHYSDYKYLKENIKSNYNEEYTLRDYFNSFILGRYKCIKIEFKNKIAKTIFKIRQGIR